MSDTTTHQDNGAVQVPLGDLRLMEDRHTARLEEHEYQALKASIATEGIRHPLDVVDVDGALVITDGFNRYRVAQELGLATVPCRVRQGTARDARLDNLIRNTQRGKADPVGMARVAAQLRDQDGLNPAQIATATGLSEQWIRQLLQISQLHPYVRDLLEQGNLGVGVGLQLARIGEHDVQIRTATLALNEGWTVGKARELVGLILLELGKPREEQRPLEAVKPPPPCCTFCGREEQPERLRGEVLCRRCSGLLAVASDTAPPPPSPPAP